MFFTEKKLAARVEELGRYRYRDPISIPSFRFQLDEAGEVGTRPPADGEWTKFEIGDSWSGRDLYAWFAAEVEVPAEWAGRKIAGRFYFKGPGAWSNFELLLYLNGKPYQGVDANHQEVIFPDHVAGTIASLQLRLWSGIENGGRPARQEKKFTLAEVSCLDETTDDLYYTAKAALETIQILGENQAERAQLLKAVDRAFLLVDWSSPGSEAFYASVSEARESLSTELKQREKHHPVTISCVGHTHIDVAWKWKLEHTREKAARSFSTVLRLMEQYPDYLFLQTMPQLYDYIKQDYPDIYKQIVTRVKEGRWEADGAMWLEADCNIPSGESLVRQILSGTSFLQDEFGVECSYLWLPDVFGYSWALPQILKKSGIDTFMTTKISWSQYNRMPHDTFRWRGIDGSEVLTHFITTPPPNNEPNFTYNGHITPKSVTGIWNNYKNKELTQELLLCFGYGDGGGGVNREMLEMRRRLDEMPGLPRVVTSRADQYFQRLQENVETSDQYVHTWDGELYLEYHRGTYTSQALIKRLNRKAELLYREAEWLHVLQQCVKSEGSSVYPQKELNEGWKLILRNQFHDIIPGSSIAEVNEESRQEYEQALQIGESCWAKAANGMMREQNEFVYTVFNSAAWERDDIVYIPLEVGMPSVGSWVDALGRPLQAQSWGECWQVYVKELPPLGFGTIRFEAGREDTTGTTPFDIYASGLTSPYYELAWNEHGQLTRIWDRRANREVLAVEGRGNVLQVFEDKPLRFDAWDIDIYYQQKMREVTALEDVQVIENGLLRAVIRFKWSYLDSTIEQDLMVYAYSGRIDFLTKVDWQESQQLMKVAFPVDIRATEATYDIQFGNVKRPTHWNTSWDWARFETVGHQWADVSEQGYGVSLLNDCKYGYDIKDHIMRLTLIKSGVYPDPHADQGEHRFTYSLYPHQGDWVQGGTVREAWSLNSELTHSKGQVKGQDTFTIFHISADHVMVSAVKKAEREERVVLRVHEFTGARGVMEVTSGMPIISWQECDLLERPIGHKTQEPVITTLIKPYEIKTFLIEL